MTRLSGNGIGTVLCLTLVMHCPPGRSVSAQDPQLIEVDGRAVRAVVAGLERADASTPVIVFEAGFMYDGLSAWTSILPDVADFAPVVAYDRAGIGGSEPDGLEPTPQHVAANLHRLLESVDAAPPYVLVGHSLGGPFIRMFAALYPDDVAGLVLIDPTPTTSEDDRRLLEAAMGLTPASRSAIAELQRQQLRNMPSPSVKAEAEMMIEQRLIHWPDFQQLEPLPDVPVAILMAGRFDPAADDGLDRSCEPRQCHRQVLAVRQRWLANQLSGVARGWLTLATDAGHFIQNDDPELVVWTIRRVWSSDPPREELRLDPAVLDQFVGVYRLNPDYTLTVTREYDQLFAQISGQGPLPIFAETMARFYYRAVVASLEFERRDDGPAAAVVLWQGGNETRWERVQ